MPVLTQRPSVDGPEVPTHNNSGQPPGSQTPADDSSPPWGKLLAAGVLAAVIAAVVIIARSSSSDSDDTSEAEVTIRAVEAEQRDLIEYTNIDGTLQYANVSTVTAGTDGLVTEVVSDGQTLSRGDAAYEVNATPIVVFYGDIPFYRTMVEGTSGDDVLLLEQNLASLGYHTVEDEDGDVADAGFTVDGTFDAQTSEAVKRWQEDLGIAETGTVPPGDVIMVPGPSQASGVVVEIGSRVQAGSTIMTLNVSSTVDGFYSAHTGAINLEATSGDVVSGQVLYTVDDLPVTAVVTDVEFVRDLSIGVEDGDDVEVLEQMLADLGYDADGDLDVDEEFDDDTTRAIEDWEEDLQDNWDDQVVDGIVSLDQIVTVDNGTTIGAVTSHDGDTLATGTELFTFGSDTGSRIVSTAVDVADQALLAEGTEIDVEFPGGEIVTGTVTDLASSSTTDPLDPSADPKLAVEITLDSVPDSAEALNELDVEVRLVDNLAAGVTVVPASALVATADGGFAVEVASGNSTSYVAVDPGMFADGFVEVDGIEPGTAVVVPS
ncbi:MAG: peptidoglycan-binding protein [Acidimicrobiia bacterium]|nr:peptidoglycan-binding protein [Acidimicrobiia bacterium]